MITDVCDPIAQSYKFMATAWCQIEQFWFQKSKQPIYCKQSKKASYMRKISKNVSSPIEHLSSQTASKKNQHKK